MCIEIHSFMPMCWSFSISMLQIQTWNYKMMTMMRTKWLSERMWKSLSRTTSPLEPPAFLGPLKGSAQAHFYWMRFQWPCLSRQTAEYCWVFSSQGLSTSAGNCWLHVSIFFSSRPCHVRRVASGCWSFEVMMVSEVFRTDRSDLHRVSD